MNSTLKCLLMMMIFSAFTYLGILFLLDPSLGALAASDRSTKAYHYQTAVPADLSITEVELESQSLCSASNSPLISLTPFSWHCKPGELKNLCTTSQGDMAENLTFIGAFKVFRHGARGPLTPVRHISAVSCSAGQSKDYQRYKEFMKKFRATRSFDKFEGPFVSYPVLPSSSKCSPSDLTVYGASQLLAVGQLANQRLSLLTNTSQMSIIALSTRYRRTVQSLWAFLYGFIGENNMEDADVKVQLNHGVTYCEPFCRCDQATRHEVSYQKLISGLLSSSSRSALKVLAHIIYGAEGAASVGARYLKDGLLMYVCHNTALPCSSINKIKQCVKQADLDKVQLLLLDESHATLNSEKFLKMSYLRAYGLIKRIIQYGSNLSTKNSLEEGPVLYVYSGHDLTLESLLSVLGLYNGMPPGFASNVMVEYYINPVFEVVIKVLLNGNDVTPSVSHCGSSYCSLDSFADKFAKQFKSLFGDGDFFQICK